MLRAQRLLVVVCAALLVGVGSWKTGVDAVGEVQSAQPNPQSSIDPLVLKSLQWRSIGPDRGGRSIAVSGVKGRPREAYFGAIGGGLWKTTDGGDDWAPVTDGQIKSSSVGAVAVSESNPDIVFIGMGESCIRGNIMPGDGVYKSTDAGKTWTHVGFADSQAISRDPHPPDQSRHRLRRRVRQVRRAERRARRLQEHRRRQDVEAKVLFRNDKTGAVDLAIDRNNPNVMYAAMWEAYRVEYQMSSGGPGSGLFKSTDGGETWTEITRNPGPAGGRRRQHRRRGLRRGLEPRLRAGRERERRPLQRRTTPATTWTIVNSNRNIRQRAFYYTHVTADPRQQRHGLRAERQRCIDRSTAARR